MGMWRKEFCDSARQLVFIMFFFPLVPLLYLADTRLYGTGLTFMEYMSNGMDLFLLIASLFMAYNIFRSEERDGATEYLLSLPLNRSRLLLWKFLPRVILLSLLLAAGWMLNDLRESQGSVLGMIFLRWEAGFAYILLFVLFVQACGLVQGMVGRDSWSTRLMLLFMVICVWEFGTVSIAIASLIDKTAGLIAVIEFYSTLGSLGRTFLDFLVFYLLLWYILRPLASSWDLKPTGTRTLWFQRRALFPMVVFLLLLISKIIAFQPELFYFI